MSCPLYTSPQLGLNDDVVNTSHSSQPFPYCLAHTDVCHMASQLADAGEHCWLQGCESLVWQCLNLVEDCQHHVGPRLWTNWMEKKQLFRRFSEVDEPIAWGRKWGICWPQPHEENWAMPACSCNAHCTFLSHIQYCKSSFDCVLQVSVLTLHHLLSHSKQRLSRLSLSWVCSLGHAKSKFLFSKRAHYFCCGINEKPLKNKSTLISSMTFWKPLRLEPLVVSKELTLSC